jgi:hydantoinase/carbamoylase family amidase
VTMGTDGDRLLARIAALARIGATASGGVSRLAFTPEEAEGRRLVAGWMAEAGLEAALDPAANLIGWFPGFGPDPALPALVLGSHLDSVVDAGPLDGPYGVLAALEVAAALAGTELAHPLAVVAFNDEEGAWGTRGMWGAHALVGALGPDDVRAPDSRGIPVAESLAAAGGDPDRIDQAAWPAGAIGAYLELHVEQGPVLDAAGLQVGVVEAITGRVNAEVEVAGAANHAGATPMGARRDALVAAAEVVLAVRDLAAGPEPVVRVATTGTVAVEPGVWNVIPGLARLGVELRDASAAAMDAGLARLAAETDRIGAATGTAITVRAGARVEPAPCHPALRAAIAAAADRLGLRRIDLPSGAGHDAQVLAAAAPVGMLFVPSIGGISHAPAEATDPADLVAGAELLLATVEGLERETLPGSR